MRNKFFIVGALALLALVVSACGPTTVNQAAPEPVRSLNVTGAGQASLTPDIAYIYIGVHTERPTASDAVTENNAQTQTLIAALKDFGIQANDIRTTNFSIWPSQQYGPDGTITGTVYMVDNTVYVTIRDLARLGDLLDAAVQAGANSVNSIQFDASDKDEALKAARADAVANAAEQAAELAEAAGVDLGEIQSISYYDNSAYPVYDAYGRGGGGGGVESAVPIQPGQLTLTVTVTITYELK
ncbi:MAG: SIMPL domain-containing protein [Chloroflexota bacterium]